VKTIVRVDGDERIDGWGKVTGGTRYAADIVRRDMIYAKVLRSPHPHARIVSIDTRGAQALPGVHAVLTAQDIPDYLLGRAMRDMPILARDKVRFVGEKVAAVAADSAQAAEAALALITVVYEELPAIFDPIEAIQPGAPLLHEPEWVRAHKTPAQQVADYPNSVSNPIYGASEAEVEAAIAAAPHVFEHEFHTPIQHQLYLEPHCATVEVDAQGVAHVWASNKAPYLLLDYLREGMGLTRQEMDIQILPLGGDFGGKGSFMDIPLAYLLAKATGRPVRIQMTMTEELIAGNPRHAATIRIRSGIDTNGRLLARWVRTYYNSGAYAAFKPAVDATLPRVLRGGLAAYAVPPVWRVEGHMVYTNTVPCGHMREPGGAQPIQAIEQHLDLCARALGLDPLDIRLINAPIEPRQEDRGGAGTIPKAQEALRVAADMIGWQDPKPAGVGRGIALVEISNSPANDYTNRLILQRDGRVVMHTPVVEQGSGMLTVFRQLVAEKMHVSVDQVDIVQTMEEDYDRGVGGSRVTRIVGRMIAIMGERLQKRMAELVAELDGWPVEDIGIESGGFRTPDGALHPFAEVAALSAREMVEILRYTPQPQDVVETYSAFAAEVHVDPETGQVTTRRATCAVEVGKVINVMGHRGQIDGGMAQGIGYALLEGQHYEDGQPSLHNLHEYRIPTVMDMPAFEVRLLDPVPELGITPIGEGPNCGMAAALGCAIMDVVNGPIDTPIHPERLVSD
jgi:CO/xanthine dehydrogenase Mo-binding subunit